MLLLCRRDTKLLKSIRPASDCLMLQADVDSLNDWCEKWKLKLNAIKCNIFKMSLSHQESYRQHQYHINGTNLQSTSCQKDLGIMVSRDLSWSNQYNKICLKAYRSLNLIRRTLPPNSSTKLKKQLYLSLVKSHMSYCSQLWRPRLIKDIQSIEGVQRKASKYILNDYTSDYNTRFLSLHLLPLMYWYELQDMFLVKYLQDPADNLDIFKYVSHSFSHSATRHFYFNRVLRLWNSIPGNVIDLSQSLVSIKHRVCEFMWSHFKQNVSSVLTLVHFI